jgi:hypothetical protein
MEIMEIIMETKKDLIIELEEIEKDLEKKIIEEIQIDIIRKIM